MCMCVCVGGMGWGGRRKDLHGAIVPMLILHPRLPAIAIGINQQLNSMLMKYNESFKGILVAFDKDTIQLVQKSGDGNGVGYACINDERHPLHLKV